MPATVQHVFINPQADLAGDHTIVKPSDWNSVHLVTVEALAAASLSGNNTAGVLAAISSGTFYLAGGNNVTLSQNGNSVTISGVNTAVQSAQTLGAYAVGNTTGQSSSTTFDARTVSIHAAGFLSAGYSAGSLVISGTQTNPVVSNAIQPVSSETGSGTNTSRFAADDHVHRGIYSAGVSNVGNTAGDTGVQAGRFVLAGGNNVTLSVSTAAGALQTVTISAFNQTAPVVSNAIQSVSSATNSGTNTSRFAADDHAHAGVFSAGVSNIGNTQGNTRVDVGRFVFAGGDNITLSQGTAANALNTITIIGPAPGGGGAGSMGLSNIGNTAGDTVTVTGRLVLAGGNNITLSGSSNGASLTVTVSAFNQTAPVVSNAIQPVSSQTGSGTNTSRFAADDHVHRGVYTAGVSNIGNTAGDTGVGPGRVVFAGGNNITLSVGTAAGELRTITISAFNQTAPVVSNAIQQVSSATGSGTNTSRFAADDHVHAGVYHAGVSNLGNTAGNTRVSFGRFVLVGGDNVTLSQATAANELNTISIHGLAPGGGAGSFGLSNVGNTAGDTATVTGRLVLAGGNNITLSGSSNGASLTVTVSAFNQTAPVVSSAIQSVSSANASGTNTSRFAADDHVHAGVYHMGVTNAGNSAGNTRVSVGRFVLHGGDNITLSQGTAANELNTITIVGPSAGGGATLSSFEAQAMGSSVAQMGNSSMRVWPMPVHQFVTATAARHVITASQSTAASTHTLRVSVSMRVGIYTRNVSTLSLASSGSQSYSWQVSSNQLTASLSNLRVLTVPINVSMTPGQYWFAFVSQTSSSRQAAGVNSWIASNFIGTLLGATVTNNPGILNAATNNFSMLYLGMGAFSDAVAGEVPNSIDLFGGFLWASEFQRPPTLIFNNFSN